VAIADLPLTFDPWAPPGTVESRLVTLTYDRIFQPDPETGTPISRVVDAESEALGWILTLHRLRWGDGRLVTAEDLCFSVATALDPRAPTWWRGPVSAGVAGCTVLDARRARIEPPPGVADPRPALAIPLVPQHGYTDPNPWFDPEITRAPVGTGRYRASATATGWTLRARGKAGIDVFRLVRAESEDRAVDRLLGGSTDGVLGAPPGRVADVIAADGLSLQWTDRRQLVLLALDTGDGPTADLTVRRGLDLLLDRTSLRERTAGVDATDERQPATFASGPFPPRSSWSARSVPPTPHDPAAAAEALTQAGYTWTGTRWERAGEPLRLRIASAAPPLGDQRLLFAICGQWIAAGVAVDAVTLSPSAYARALAGDPPPGLDALLMTWNPPWDDSPAPLVGTGGWSNPFGYADPAIDRELVGLQDPDPEIAQRAAWELHGRLADRAPFLFLWANDAWSAWSSEAVTFTPFTPGDFFGLVDRWH
jgi:ABC-type transport system substrate-binding protein